MNHVLAPFLTFVAMFIGAGFISGGIVHLGEGFNTWDISLLFLGIVLFVIGSYVQESVYNQKNLKEEGVIPFLFYSLILSIGIGMASGGTQHFLDTPTYSMYLIPAGLFIGLIAFVFKLNIKMTRKEWFLLISGSSIALLVLGLLLAFIASSLPSSLENDAHGHGSVNGESMMPLHQIEINNEADFIEHMIPHHQEAVDSSRYLLSNVDDVAKKDFLQNIIETQSNEIKQMKDWYLAWFGQEYSDDNSYKPMMSDLTSYDKETMIQIYANEMIAHHMSAVEIAEKIQSITNKSELKTMAENIIVNQNKEIEILKTWLTNEMYMGAIEDDMHAH